MVKIRVEYFNDVLKLLEGFNIEIHKYEDMIQIKGVCNYDGGY